MKQFYMAKVHHTTRMMSIIDLLVSGACCTPAARRHSS